MTSDPTYIFGSLLVAVLMCMCAIAISRWNYYKKEMGLVVEDLNNTRKQLPKKLYTVEVYWDNGEFYNYFDVVNLYHYNCGKDSYIELKFDDGNKHTIFTRSVGSFRKISQ